MASFWKDVLFSLKPVFSSYTSDLYQEKMHCFSDFGTIQKYDSIKCFSRNLSWLPLSDTVQQDINVCLEW